MRVTLNTCKCLPLLSAYYTRNLTKNSFHGYVNAHVNLPENKLCHCKMSPVAIGTLYLGFGSLNSLMTSGFNHLYHLGESTLFLGASGVFLRFYELT